MILNRYALLISIFVLLTGCGEVSYKTTSIDNNTTNLFSTLSKKERETFERLHTTQQKLLDAINKERSESRTCGSRGTFPAVQSLTWNDTLHSSALEHVTDLAYSDTFSHDGSGTKYDITGQGKPSKFYERIVRNGYKNYYSVGENIAGGQRNVEEVMKAWMASPGHCANIMKATYTQVGIAIIIKPDSDYQIYWGQNFGSQKR